jgi:hypothetical protein
MSNTELNNAVNSALANVDNNRRGFLKTLLLGSAAIAALPLLKSNAMAAAMPQDDGKGTDGGKGKGKGKGKGTDTGKGDGKGF